MHFAFSCLISFIRCNNFYNFDKFVGIDVDYEVERPRKDKGDKADKDGEKKCKGGRGRGRHRGGPHGRRGCSGPPYGQWPYGMWGWMGGCPMGEPEGRSPGPCGRRAGGQCGNPQQNPPQSNGGPSDNRPQQGQSGANGNNMEPPKRTESPKRMVRLWLLNS